MWEEKRLSKNKEDDGYQNMFYVQPESVHTQILLYDQNSPDITNDTVAS